MILTSDIDLLGIDRVLKRGTGKILEERDGALLAFDEVSKAYFLACDDVALAFSVFGPYAEKCLLLMCANIEVGRAILEKYGFGGSLECYQVAYYGAPPEMTDRLTVRVADKTDLPFLTKVYHLISEEEMAEVVGRGSLILAYEGESLVGFMGEHLEGSMGLLFILPEHRRKGYATELERLYIRKTVKEGFIPFGQVEKSNLSSLKLQEKLGLVRSDNIIIWMWK